MRKEVKREREEESKIKTLNFSYTFGLEEILSGKDSLVVH